MKMLLILSVFGVSVLSLQAGLSGLGEHVDLRWSYDATLGEWSLRAVTAEQVFDPSEVFLPLSDKPYSAKTPVHSGARAMQPSAVAYSFTGIAPGEPLWLAVQGAPGVGEAWPGFENAQEAGIFGEYFEADSRLQQPQTLARPWIRVTLKSFVYQGTGAQPTFSLWTVVGGSPRAWMSSADGIGAEDFFLYAAGTHIHMNWGFGALGIYRLQLAASAYAGPGQTNPTVESEVFTVTFAVGPVAEWQASHFAGAELDDPMVSGLAADPDGDGLANLQEYAFGLDPRSGQSDGLAAGLGLPRFSRVEEAGVLREVLEYPRRKSMELTNPVLYAPEFSVNLAEGDWSLPGEVVEVASEFAGDQADLADSWEKVELRRAVPVEGAAQGFWRVRVVQAP